MTTRQDIADALTGTELVTASAHQPNTLASKMAWPAGPQLERRPELGWQFEATWQVWVILPGDDERTRNTWFDANAINLADALHAHLFVDSIERTTFTTDGGNLPAALITGRSE